MSISIFEVAGPVMIGPSSSHTAGAARLARMARLIAGGDFNRVEFGLYGSFAKTYMGHGTDMALVAGVLGFSEYDERLPDAFNIAKSIGIDYKFYETEIRDGHENSVRITFMRPDDTKTVIEGCSIGGGRMCITNVDGFETEMYCDKPSAMVLHKDQKGMLSRITTEMAFADLNIAVMRSSRRKKGDVACCVLESDQKIDPSLEQHLIRIPGVIKVSIIDPDDIVE